MTLGGVKALGFVFLLALTGCGGQEESPVLKPDEPIVEKPSGIQLSDKEIRLQVGDWKPLTESRATLYEGEEDIRDGGTVSSPKPGGYFTLYGYIDGTDDVYLGGATAYWDSYNNRNEWIFLSGKDEITYYWPNSDAVNFFAYMPYKGYSGNLKHYISNFQYSESTGQTFDCALPETNDNDANEIEFIYAYKEEQTKANNPLELEFKHPFAAIYFKLSPESSRMTINSIALADVYLNGTFSCERNEWIPNGNPGTFTATIDKRIPNDVNYNTIFAGPYLVMPQALSNQVKLVLNAKRAVDGDSNNETTVTAETNLTNQWEPGKKYIYTLEMGDRNEEIYFNVAVEDWIKVGYKNEVNVE